MTLGVLNEKAEICGGCVFVCSGRLLDITDGRLPAEVFRICRFAGKGTDYGFRASGFCFL